MPIYEYQCPVHGIFDRLRLITENTTKSICLLDEDCTKLCEKIWSKPANINIGKPTIVFHNKLTGETETAVNDFDQPPFGYVREELKNSIERSKFEKEESFRKNVENEVISEQTYLNREAITKERQANIRAKMGSYDHQTQALLNAAMERTRNRKFKPKKTEVRFDVNHRDQSNMIVEAKRKIKVK